MIKQDNHFDITPLIFMKEMNIELAAAGENYLDKVD